MHAESTEQIRCGRSRRAEQGFRSLLALLLLVCTLWRPLSAQPSSTPSIPTLAPVRAESSYPADSSSRAVQETDALRSQHQALESQLGTLLLRLELKLDALEHDRQTPVAVQREETRALVQEALRLHRERLALQSRLLPQDRLAFQQVTERGLRQLELEVRLLILLVRWYPAHRVAQVTSELWKWEAKGWKQAEWHTLGARGWLVGQLLALTVLLLVVRRWHERWFGLLSALILGKTGQHSASLYLDRWLRFFTAVTFDVLLLGYFYLGFALLLRLSEAPGVVLLRALALAFGWYRLATISVHHVLVSAVATTHVEVSAETSRRILRSLRFIGRYVLGVAVLLLAIEHLLGIGTLFVMLAEFSWLGLLPALLRVVREWQLEIVRIYTVIGPPGRLRAALEHRQGRFSGLPAATLAAFPVMSLGISSWLNELALTSEQTRSALTYVFRRKLEQHAQANMGEGWTDENLSDSLLTAFGIEEVASQPLVERFPGLESIQKALTAWREGLPGRAVAVIGEWGSGRSTWLNTLWMRTHTTPDDRLVRFTRRLYSEEEVCLELSNLLGLGQLHTVAGVVETLRAQPRRLILLDDCHALILRSVGGMGGIDALIRVVGRTSDHHFWICTFSRYPWLHLLRTQLPSDLFSPVVEVDAWSADDIGSLIALRMAKAEVSASYRDLIVEQRDGVGTSVEVIRTGQRYLRLIWDYSNGNPSVSLQCWLRSLVPDGPQRVRVKLFDAPQTDDLEPLSQRSRYVLHALVTHEGLTVEELARVLRFELENLDAVLRTLVRAGLAQELAGGRFHTQAHAYSAVLRHLWRKNLLFD